jgi:hypothetical protein
MNMLRDNIIRIGRGLRFVVESPSLIKFLPLFIRASLLYVNQYTVYLRMKYPRLMRFDYYHYADWDETHVENILHELQWQLPDDCTSSWRADCMFESVKNRIFKEQLGFTYAEAFYSNLIRSGKIERQEALDRISEERISESRLNKALGVIGLTGLFSDPKAPLL